MMVKNIVKNISIRRWSIRYTQKLNHPNPLKSIRPFKCGECGITFDKRYPTHVGLERFEGYAGDRVDVIVFCSLRCSKKWLGE